jgi:hypothetical protein
LGAAQEPSFKSGISIVEVHAAVVDKAGPIDGLQPGDFAVQDNRHPVTLRYGQQDESVLDVVFLFEISKLMASKVLQVRIASEMAMAELREGDRVAVLSFKEEARVELPLTSDLKAAKLRIRNGRLMRHSAGAYIYCRPLRLPRSICRRCRAAWTPGGADL